MNGLDEAGLGRRVAERPADLGYADLQHPVGHVGTRPDLVEELVLQDELAAALDQHPQDLERLGVEGDRTPRVLEPLVGAVEAEAIEMQRHWVPRSSF